MTDLIFIMLIVAMLWFWSNSLQAREAAMSVVKAHCRRLDLQLLDDYVALTGFWPKRNAEGRIQAWRSYAFEFSATGVERYNGKIVMLGRRVESIYLEPYRVADESAE